MSYFTGCTNGARSCNVDDASEQAWRTRCEACNTYVVACTRSHNWSPVQPKKSYEQMQAAYFTRLKEELKEDTSPAIIIRRVDNGKK